MAQDSFLLSFVGGDEDKSIISCCREAEAGNPAAMTVGWSDIPCQGEYGYNYGHSLGDTSLSPSPVPLAMTLSDEEDEESDVSDTTDDDEEMEPRERFSTMSSKRSAPLQTLQQQQQLAIRSTKSQRRRVSFNQELDIRCYGLMLGDHPLTRGGLSLQFDWNYSRETSHNLDVYEQRSMKRRGEALRLPYSERRRRLEEHTGMTEHELLRLQFQLGCQGIEHSSIAFHPIGMHRSKSVSQNLGFSP